MGMRFKLTVEVEVERQQGKFASRDEIEDQLREWLESANEGSVSGVGSDGDSEYDVVDWSVS